MNLDELDFVALSNKVAAVYYRQLGEGAATSEGLEFYSFNKIVEDFCGAIGQEMPPQEKVNDLIDILTDSGLIDFIIRKATWLAPGVSVVDLDVSYFDASSINTPADPISRIFEVGIPPVSREETDTGD